VPLNDCSQRGELLRRSVKKRKGDGEVHLVATQPLRLDRPPQGRQRRPRRRPRTLEPASLGVKRIIESPGF
jgi:hypothetical protein